MSRKDAKQERAVESKPRQRRDEAWDERLRTVGDAKFVEVQWSGRDEPNWPVPAK